MPFSDRESGHPELLIVGLGNVGGAALHSVLAHDVDVVGLEQRSGEDGPHGRYGCRVWGLFPDGTVAASDASGTWHFTPRATIVATGCIDIPLPVPGWHLPGAKGAYRASRTLSPGTPVVVLRGPHAETGPSAPALAHLDILHDELLADGRDINILGDDHVVGVRIGATSISTTSVVLDNGRQVENGLARMAGIPSTFDVAAGGDAITPGAVFAAGGTLISVIGDAAGTGATSDAMLHDAAHTAMRLASTLRGEDIPAAIPSARTHPVPSGQPMLPLQTTGATMVCPAEGITVQQVLDAVTHGATTVNDVKRRTRAGMHICQGRDCAWTIRAILARHDRQFEIPMTARPPISGITVAELAALGTS